MFFYSFNFSLNDVMMKNHIISDIEKNIFKNIKLIYLFILSFVNVTFMKKKHEARIYCKKKD